MPDPRAIARYPAAAFLVACACVAPVVTLRAPMARADVDLSTMTVFLDPGHNGAYDSSITRQVPNGRGGSKDCQTTGTSTADGYPEHTFDWDVAIKVKTALDKMGVHTALSRTDDDAPGSCVDARAAAANALKPDAIVSIHADGGPPSGSGFHVNYSSPPLNDVQAGPALALATQMRDALDAAQLPRSTYLGTDGLYGRADLAGLNFAQYPAVLVELGNMRNADDAARMQSDDGRTRYAAALTRGIVEFLEKTSG